jgi:hypothetical protein
MPRLPTAAVVCGAALIGISLGGVASTGQKLQQAAATQESRPFEHVVLERHDHPCPDHSERSEL